jgi:outer membrane protein assembly factor BamB
MTADEREPFVELDRFWDRLVRGERTTPAALPAESAATMRWFQTLDDASAPPRGTLDRIWQELTAATDPGAPVATGAIPLRPGPPHGLIPGPHRPPLRRVADHWLMTLLATAALLLVTLAAIYFTLIAARSEPSPAGPPTPPVSGVPMYRGDAARTGVMPGPGPGAAPAELWRVAVGKTHASPVVVDGVAYVAGTEALVAVDAATGEERWRVAIPGRWSTPAVVDGVVYVGSNGRYVYALDAADGSERWRFDAVTDPRRASPTPGEPDPVMVYASPAVVDGIVFVEASGIADNLAADLFAIDAATGQQRWHVTLPRNGALSSPAVVDGVAYFGTSFIGFLYALDAQTGVERWHVAGMGNANVAVPAVADGTVYLGNNLGDLYAFDAATGGVRWSVKAGGIGAFTSSVAVGDGVVYAGTTDGALYAVDGATGAERWHLKLGSQAISSPALVASVVYVNSVDGTVSAVDATSGTVLWTASAGGGMSSPTVAGGLIYLVNGDGFLVALGTSAPATHDTS